MGTTKAMGACRAAMFGVLALGLITGGRSDTKSRRVDKQLLDAVETAQRLYARAISLMSSTPIKMEGQYAPPSAARGKGVSPSGTVELPPPMAVNPEAWDALVKAEKGLASALGEYGRDADPSEQAIAQTLMGDILLLEAKYKSAASAADKQDVRDTVVLADRAVSMVQLYTRLVAYSNQLTALGNRDVVEMLAAAQQEAAKVKESAAQTQTEIQSLQAQSEQLRAANEKLIPQIRQIRLEADQTGGARRMELLDQAFKIEAEVNEKVSAIAALENTLELQQAALADLTLQIQAAEGQQKAAEAIVEARKSYSGQSTADLEAVQAALAKAAGDVQQQIMHLAEVCQKLSSAQDAAAEVYGQAVMRYETAKRLRSGGRDPQLTARLADAHWSLADLKNQSLTFRRLNIQLLERLAAAGQSQTAGIVLGGEALELPESLQPAVPAFARGVLAYVPDPQQVRKDAIENYQQAGELYDTAAVQAPVMLRWAYQGQAAATYIALYQLAPSPEVLAKAKEALHDALEDKRESSYLNAVVELERLLQVYIASQAKESATAPKRASAPPPTEPGTPAAEPNAPAVAPGAPSETPGTPPQ